MKTLKTKLLYVLSYSTLNGSCVPIFKSNQLFQLSTVLDTLIAQSCHVRVSFLTDLLYFTRIKHIFVALLSVNHRFLASF